MVLERLLDDDLHRRVVRKGPCWRAQQRRTQQDAHTHERHAEMAALSARPAPTIAARCDALSDRYGKLEGRGAARGAEKRNVKC